MQILVSIVFDGQERQVTVETSANMASAVIAAAFDGLGQSWRGTVERTGASYRGERLQNGDHIVVTQI